MSKKRVKQIKDELSNLFSDTSVKPSQTRAELEEIREEIDGMLELLPSKAE